MTEPAGPPAGRAVRPRPDPAALFPAGTAVSRLAVYDWPGPDGQPGGSAHVHLACTEGYVVVAGRGRLQTLGADGFAETPLGPAAVAWFSPGVVHRLINDGGLQLVVVMQNGGLPEAGDAVLTFPPGQLASPDAYRAAAALPTPSAVASGGQPDPVSEAARRRKDLALTGFLRLRERFEREGPAALDEFYAAAAALVRDRAAAWREVWAAGPLAAAESTGAQISALAAGQHDHLRRGRLTVLGAPDQHGFGMCGRLDTYQRGRLDT